MKKYSFGIIAFGLTMALISCNSNNNSNSETISEEVLVNNEEIARAQELMTTNCFACHSPKEGMGSRMAPPMIAIKKHYIDEQTTLADFTKDMVNFVNNPSEEHMKMPGAVRKFGLMPKLNFPEEDLVLIAKYIFENEIEEPEWFQKHFEEEHSGGTVTANSELSITEKGMQLALSTKKILGKNLMGAINAKGSAYAVDFCQTKAIHLLDSMSNQLNAQIKRVTDQPRNPDAQANSVELKIINQFKKSLSKGEEMVSVLDETDELAIGYYPITTNQMCLQCHGSTSQDINTKTLAKINQLYPNDKATGYDVNQLRGIWVVEMTK